MILLESKLRKLIRDIILEQVVGYTPPSKKNKDDSYMSYGDVSSPSPEHVDSTDDPEEYEQLGAESQMLTKQKQKAVNARNAPTANYDARTLQKLKNKTG